MLVAIIIVVVLLLLVAVMRWGDRRDRAKGHVNRRTGDLRSAIRAGKENKLKTQFRRPPGPLA